MKRHIKEAEREILDLLNSPLSDDGLLVKEKYSLAENLSEIPEIPVKDFNELLSLIRKGEAVIRMAPSSIDSLTFDILSTKTEKFLFSTLNFCFLLLPIAGIALGIFFSWWYALWGIILAYLFLKLNKKIYCRALFRGALSSEVIFSFLFTGYKITLELLGQGFLYRSRI